jgi:hypothetical protein
MRLRLRSTGLAGLGNGVNANGGGKTLTVFWGFEFLAVSGSQPTVCSHGNHLCEIRAVFRKCCHCVTKEAAANVANPCQCS